MKQIISFYWKYNEDRDLFSQWFSLLDHQTEKIEKVNLLNYRFNFQLSSLKFCVGYSDKGRYYACPKKSIIENSNFDRCGFCESKIGFKAAFFYGEKPNARMQAHLNKDHYVYLAYFPRNIVKVGTAVSKRLFIRLIEQDARGFIPIAKAEGHDIQKLEHYISKRFGIRESVTSKHKIKFINYKSDPKLIKESLLNSWQVIKKNLETHNSYASWLLKTVNFVDLSLRKEIFYPNKDVQIVQYPNYLSGECFGLRGKYLIIKNLGDYYALKYTNIVGRFVDDYLNTEKEYFKETDQIKLDL